MHLVSSPRSLHAIGSRAPTRWNHAGFRVSAERRGAGGTAGGDFCTLSVRAPGRIGVIIGDACGRGLEGAAQLSKILPRIHELALSGALPSELLAELNHVVAAELPIDRFVTAAAFELDMQAGMLTVANAAHVPGIVRRARDHRVSIIGRASGMPLGIAPDTTYVDERHELGRGDVLVLMTDGLLEAVEPDLVSMGTLVRFLAEASAGANDVHRFLLRKFEECSAAKRADDMTLVALEAAPGTRSGTYLDLARAS